MTITSNMKDFDPASIEHNHQNVSYFTSHIIFDCFEPFHCCLSLVLWPEEGDFPENLHRVVYVLIKLISVLLNLLCVWILF